MVRNAAWRGGALLLLLAAIVGSPGDARAIQGSQDVVNANFDQGIGQWIVSPPSDGVSWAADATPAMAPPSPPNSLNFNDGVDFQGFSFQAVQGTADSPPFNLTGATSVTLTFQCRFQTEGGNFYDQKWVRMSNNGFATNVLDQQVWQGNANQQGNCTGQLVWHPHIMQIFGAAQPNMQLRFFFNSVDGAGNNGQGWAVDNVVLSAIGLPPPPAPPAAGGGSSAPPDPPKDVDYDNRIDELREENCGSGSSSSGWMLLAACVLALGAGLARRS